MSSPDRFKSEYCSSQNEGTAVTRLCAGPEGELTQTGSTWGRRAALWCAAVLAAAGLVACGPSAPSADPPPPTPDSPALAERGAYLARIGNCALCHTARGGAPYAGGRPIATPFGTVYSANLTPDATNGLGTWQAQDLRRALHQGQSKDGRALVPACPYPNFTLVSAGDVDALFAFLKRLPPVPQPRPAHELRFPYGSAAAQAAWRSLFFTPGRFQEQAHARPEWNRGAYLTQGLAHCSACHGQRNFLGANGGAADFRGGPMPTGDGHAPALDLASEGSVAAWPLDDVVRFLQTGRSGNGASTTQQPEVFAQGPMAEVVLHSTQHLSTADAQAMASYLRQLPQRQGGSSIGTSNMTQAPSSNAGAALYEKHCESCHGKEGQGVPGAYPALAHSRAVRLPSPSNLIRTVLRGGFAPATAGNPRPFGMPPFATELNDEEVAAVLSHLRSAWGRQAGAVSALEVSRQRGGLP